MNKEKFCSKCGSKLVQTIVPNSTYAFMGHIPYDDFDTNTGEKLVAIEFKCPNKTWLNNHDNFGNVDFKESEVNPK